MKRPGRYNAGTKYRRYKTHRSLFFIIFLGALLLAACGSQATPAVIESVAPTAVPADVVVAEAPKLVEWFAPPAGIMAHWDVALDPQNPGVVLITPKNGAGEVNRSTQAAHLFFLLTKGTAAFDRSIELVLTTFLERGFNTRSAVMLAPEAESVPAALAYAEANAYELIYAVGSDAAKFTYENYSGGKLPVVTVLAKDPVLLGQTADYFSGSGSNIAFTSVSVPVEVQMTYFRQLVPALKYIAVLYDSNNSSAVKTQVDPLVAYGEANGLTIIHVATTAKDDPAGVRLEMEDQIPGALARLGRLDPENVQSIFLVTNSSAIVDVFDAVDTLAGNVPVVTLLPNLVMEGDVSALLSVAVSFDSNAILAGVYGIRILEEGANPGSLPVGVITPPDVALNFFKARQIGLRIPFTLFESAAYVYDANGNLVREKGQMVP